MRIREKNIFAESDGRHIRGRFCANLRKLNEEVRALANSSQLRVRSRVRRCRAFAETFGIVYLADAMDR